MVYIIAAILIFGVLIGLHELGHFMAAKACGVRVNEFAIGMGPALIKKQKGETLYALRLLPIGGYCAMEGEEEDSGDPRALNNQGFWKKLLIYAAGAFMNFLTGLVIILCLYAGAKGFSTTTIAGFMEGCPLEREDGLQVGDRIVSINGEHVYATNDISMLLSLDTDGVSDLVVRRNGQKIVLKDFPIVLREYPDGYGGTALRYGLLLGYEEATFGNRIVHSWNNALDFVRMVRLSIQMLISGQAGVKDLSGPVGIVSTISEVGEQSRTVRDAIDNIAYFAALIAVNLAVMNLLPLPALDGGKIFFLVINAIAMLLFKKQIPAKYENYIHFAGLILLLGLMLFVTFHDVWKLFT